MKRIAMYIVSAVIGYPFILLLTSVAGTFSNTLW